MNDADCLSSKLVFSISLTQTVVKNFIRLQFCVSKNLVKFCVLPIFVALCAVCSFNIHISLFPNEKLGKGNNCLSWYVLLLSETFVLFVCRKTELANFCLFAKICCFFISSFPPNKEMFKCRFVVNTWGVGIVVTVLVLRFQKINSYFLVLHVFSNFL